MDPVRNPYAPGAGVQAPELAGREELQSAAAITLARIRAGRSAKSILMVGLRGVGKTVLLDRLRADADEAGLHTVWIEAPENRSLPSMLAPQLRTGLLKLSRIEKAKDSAQRALTGLAGFAKALKFTFDDTEVGFSFGIEPEQGLADNGDLESDLSDLFALVGTAAKAANTVVVLFIDEMQYIKGEELAVLISALHRVAQSALPVTLVGAGLPQLPGNMGDAKSYAERLFDIRTIGPLDDTAARDALVLPAKHEDVEYTEEAVQRIIRETEGYPYFLQELGEACLGCRIRVSDRRRGCGRGLRDGNRRS